MKHVFMFPWTIVPFISWAENVGMFLRLPEPAEDNICAEKTNTDLLKEE